MSAELEGLDGVGGGQRQGGAGAPQVSAELEAWMGWGGGRGKGAGTPQVSAELEAWMGWGGGRGGVGAGAPHVC